MRDPATSVFIAAEFLHKLKMDTPYADVPADQMSPEQCKDLAARYKDSDGGHNLPDAKAYGKQVWKYGQGSKAAFDAE